MSVGYPFVRIVNKSRYTYIRRLKAKEVRIFDEKAKERFRKSYTKFYEEIYKMYEKGEVFYLPEPVDEAIQEMQEALVPLVIRGVEEGEELKYIKLHVKLPTGYYILDEVFTDDDISYVALRPLKQRDIIDFMVRAGITDETIDYMASASLAQDFPIDLVELASWLLQWHTFVVIQTYPTSHPHLLELDLHVCNKVYKIIIDPIAIDTACTINKYPKMAVSRHGDYNIGVVKDSVTNGLIMWESEGKLAKVIGML